RSLLHLFPWLLPSHSIQGRLLPGSQSFGHTSRQLCPSRNRPVTKRSLHWRRKLLIHCPALYRSIGLGGCNSAKQKYHENEGLLPAADSRNRKHVHTDENALPGMQYIFCT